MLGTFRGLLNELRRSINVLKDEQEALSQKNNRLQQTADDYEAVEKEIREVANTENIDRLTKALDENKKINLKMKKHVEADIVQHIITTVLREDRNMDLNIGPRELNRLIHRLHAKPGFDLNEDLFREMVGSTTMEEPVPVENILKVIKNLKDSNTPENGNVFVINTRALIIEEE